MKNIFQELVNKNNFQLSKDKLHAYGMINKWPITLTTDTNRLITLSIMIQESDYYLIMDPLKERLKAVKLHCNFRKDTLSISLGSNKKVFDHFDHVKTVFLSESSKSSIKPINECPYCNQGNCDIYGVNNNVYTSMHRTCKTQHLDKAIQEVQDDKGNLITGTIGALLGALGVVVACVILASLFNVAIGYLFAAIPLASLGLYRFFKGPLSIAGLIAITVSTLLAFLFYVYGSILIILEIPMTSIPTITMWLSNLEKLANFWFEALFTIIGLISILLTRPLSKKGNIDSLSADSDIITSIPDSKYEPHSY